LKNKNIASTDLNLRLQKSVKYDFGPQERKKIQYIRCFQENVMVLKEISEGKQEI
jgi:hypothetical protein